MRIKQRLEDFRVRELLRPDYVTATGEWRVYRVTKKKMTSMEAATALAREAGVSASEVSMAGFKDRQGITVQHMTVRRGREVLVAARDIKIEAIGFAESELTSHDSDGNAFEVVVRGLDRVDLETLRANVQPVRDEGVINYFDEQRFGNLRHGQGWIALDLLHGEHEKALKMLVGTPSVADDPKTKAFRTALHHAWGNWAECRDIAGRFGQHHSVFEYLKKNPDDFAGSFFHLASRLRLIHLYAYQSHLWNRAVANLVRARTERAERLVVDSEEGPLLYPVTSAKLADLGATFRLPGPGLEDVTHVEQRRALEEVLSRDKIGAADFDIRGVSGFQLKGEDRALFIQPGHLRVRPAEPDQENPPHSLVKLRFDLPRGAYATLVVRRLLARPLSDRDVSEGELGEIGPPDLGPAPRERDDFGRGYGHRTEAPRGFHRDGGDRAFRPRSEERGDRGDRGNDRGGDRGGDRYERRPYQGDRPQRGGDERGRGGYQSDSRPYRSGSDDRGGARPYRPRLDDRSFDRSPDRGGDRGADRGGDRPYRRPYQGDRPQRSGDERGHGGFQSGSRPYRSSSDDRGGARPYRPRPDDRAGDRGGDHGGDRPYRRPYQGDRPQQRDDSRGRGFSGGYQGGDRPYRSSSSSSHHGGDRPYRRPYQGDRPFQRDDRGRGEDRPRPSGGDDRGGSNRPFRGGGYKPRGFGHGRDERSGGDRPLR